MSEITGAPGAKASAATDGLGDAMVRLGEARDAANHGVEDERAAAEAAHAITFEHLIDGRAWTVHVAPSTARGRIADADGDADPSRPALEAWVADNRPMLADAAERKVRAGAAREPDVWVHHQDFA